MSNFFFFFQYPECDKYMKGKELVLTWWQQIFFEEFCSNILLVDYNKSLPFLWDTIQASPSNSGMMEVLYSPVGENLTQGTLTSGLKVRELISPLFTPGKLMARPRSSSVSWSISALLPKSVIFLRFKYSCKQWKINLMITKYALKSLSNTK